MVNLMRLVFIYFICFSGNTMHRQADQPVRACFRQVNLYKNGQFLGKAWGDLPDEVYPFVTLSQPDASAEITFPRFESEIARYPQHASRSQPRCLHGSQKCHLGLALFGFVASASRFPERVGVLVCREQRQSALYLDFLASQPPKPPPLPPLEYMIRNTLEYKEPVIKEIKKAIRYLKRELQGARWDLNTAGVWIRLHKARWSLWVLGVRGPPVTKFVNGEDEKLVMRGDGNSPPRTEEEDAAFMRTDAARELVALGDEEAGLGALLEDGVRACELDAG